MHHYLLYHFRLSSSLPFPELRMAAPAAGVPEVVIREAAVPASLAPGACRKAGELFDGFLQYEWDGHGLLVRLQQIARMMIHPGSITVEREAGITDAVLRLYLLGSGLGFWMQQNGIFPFHGSSVVHTDGSVFLFAGPSGAGKSTLAGKFVQEGARLLADDVSVVRFDAAGRPLVWPGPPFLKMWTDSAAVLALPADEKNRVRPGLEKFRMPVPDRLAEEPFPLSALVLLAPGTAPGIALEPLAGTDKIAGLLSSVYRGRGIDILDRQADHFRFCTRLAGCTAVWRLERPPGPFQLPELYDLLQEKLRP